MRVIYRKIRDKIRSKFKYQKSKFKMTNQNPKFFKTF